MEIFPEKRPKISFVIPAYNESATLPECVDSIKQEIARQGVSAEIIVVNNASTDNTKELAIALGVRVVDEPKKGITRARQAGLVASQGEILANIDADNRLPRGWLQKVLSEFDASPSLVCLSGPLVYHDLSFWQQGAVWLFNRLAYGAYLLSRFVFRLGSVVQGGNFTVRRDAMQAIGGFNTSIQFYGEDTDLAVRLSPLGPVRFSMGAFIFSSGRRLASEGVLKTGARYALNYFSVLLSKKPATRHYKDIRD